jgi:hypothetical protein
MIGIQNLKKESKQVYAGASILCSLVVSCTSNKIYGFHHHLFTCQKSITSSKTQDIDIENTKKHERKQHKNKTQLENMQSVTTTKKGIKTTKAEKQNP